MLIPAAYYGYMALAVVATAAVVWWRTPDNQVREGFEDQLSNLANAIEGTGDVAFDFVGIDGQRIRVHKYDPHTPVHGHIQTGRHAGRRVNPVTGEIYNDQGRVVGKLSKKGLEKLQKGMKDKGFLPEEEDSENQEETQSGE